MTQPPSLIKRAINVSQAIVTHIASGLHRCTPEATLERFNICKSNQCGLFIIKGKSGVCAHEDCGCNIRPNGRFIDKLSWAESQCPLDLWGTIEGKTSENPENGV